MGNSFKMVVFGVVVGVIICWVAAVAPLSRELDSARKRIEEWERITRIEREAIITLKTMSIDELKKWVAALHEQNVRYERLQQKLHQQELSLNSGHSTTLLVLIAVLVLGVAGATAWIYRDENAKDATTLDNAVQVLPALHRALMKQNAVTGHLSQSEGILISVGPRGEVVDFDAKRGFGFLQPDDGGPTIFFHVNDIARWPEGRKIQVGQSATFQHGEDFQGRKCARKLEFEKHLRA